MGFASAYLDEKAVFQEFIKEAPQKNTGLIVVVPSYDEPDIVKLIDSLALCDKPNCDTEVIVVVNAPADASIKSLENNKLTVKSLETWRNNHTCFFKLFILEIDPGQIKDWGVGLARKTGMDEAVRRFNSVNRPDGVIMSLDADCTVDTSYFTAIYEELLNRKDRSACSVYFEHTLSGNEFSDINYRSVALYELHLRYYFQALAYTGFPYVHHTVGSVIAVKALQYIKAGGMNRRKAGEDFYFIQKLVPSGGYFNLNSTTVRPSPRCSRRVPFGTGATISRLYETGCDTLLTYNRQAFCELKEFFDHVDEFYSCPRTGLEGVFHVLPDGIKSFLSVDEWIKKIPEIQQNTSGLSSFRKRFFSWFNMFKVVKYLNHIHESYFPKRPVQESASDLLNVIGYEFSGYDPVDLLLFYRELEKLS
jgi:hypothetical protein